MMETVALAVWMLPQITSAVFTSQTAPIFDGLSGLHSSVVSGLPLARGGGGDAACHDVVLEDLGELRGAVHHGHRLSRAGG